MRLRRTVTRNTRDQAAGRVSGGVSPESKIKRNRFGGAQQRNRRGNAGVNAGRHDTAGLVVGQHDEFQIGQRQPGAGRYLNRYALLVVARNSRIDLERRHANPVDDEAALYRFVEYIRMYCPDGVNTRLSVGRRKTIGPVACIITEQIITPFETVERNVQSQSRTCPRRPVTTVECTPADHDIRLAERSLRRYIGGHTIPR